MEHIHMGGPKPDSVGDDSGLEKMPVPEIDRKTPAPSEIGIRPEDIGDFVDNNSETAEEKKPWEKDIPGEGIVIIN